MSDQAQEQSPQERMIALLGAEENQEALIDAPVEAQADEQNPEVQAESETEAEAQPETRKLKLKWNGEEVEKDESEVVELAQKGFDYTQKTQTLAEERKVIDERNQAIKAQEEQIKHQTEIQQALIKDIAKVTSIDEQLAEYDKVNWSQLTDQDPAYAQKAFMQYTALRDRKNSMVQELNQKASYLKQQQQSRYEEMLNKGREALNKDLPGWNTDKFPDIKEAAKSLGYQDNELAGVTDPRVFKALYEVAQYRKLQSSKSQMENKVAGKPPVVKPGSRDTKATANNKYATDRQALKKTGDANLAAKLIEQML
jgi:hypothetical protein